MILSIAKNKILVLLSAAMCPGPVSLLITKWLFLAIEKMISGGDLPVKSITLLQPCFIWSVICLSLCWPMTQIL